MNLSLTISNATRILYKYFRNSNLNILYERVEVHGINFVYCGSTIF